MRLFVKPSDGRRRLAAVVVSSAAVVGLGASVWLQQASGAAKTLATFTTPGYYSWKVPTGITSVTFDVYGASGGNVLVVHNGVVSVVTQGGAGGEATGRFSVHAGEVFVIAVGGHGGSVTEGMQNTGQPGLNGGGTGDDATGLVGGGTLVSGGGGGASDVRIGGRGNSCLLSPAQIPCQYTDRIIVAGGGGGGSDGNTTGGNGGVGGGVNGGGPAYIGGSQEIPGGGSVIGREAGFGFGATAEKNTGIGGGGGGWYGGGSAKGTGGGSGGGSGYISRLSLSGSFPGRTRTGDGEVIITTP